MGGQACVLYGAAEFSRDLDLTVGMDTENIEAVRRALERLDADVVFVPDLSIPALEKGHACHFRCHAPGVEGLRIDLMARMRGCQDFDGLWLRRTILDLAGIGEIGVLSLPDLVQAKKTQRDKDWPMIRRLVEADYRQYRDNPSLAQLRFWLLECRTPAFLVELAGRFPQECATRQEQRGLLRVALQGDQPALEIALRQEEEKERQADKAYWAPLREELEKWRRAKRGERA